MSSNQAALEKAAATVLEETAAALTRHEMIAPGDAVLVAVSGGVDSVTLLWSLLQLAPRFSIRRLGVAHLNHCLRKEASADDMAFVQRLAEAHDLSCHVETVDVTALAQKERLSLEEAARRARYAFFDKIASQCGYNRIATAHHADDNAEQVLMSLLRGSGPTGLSGIPPVRENRIIRPFIGLTRLQIEQAARAACLEHVTDATNSDVGYFRNRVRHQLLPLLEKAYSPKISAHLNRAAMILREENAWLEGQTDAIFEQVLLRRTDHEVVFSAALLSRHPPAVQRRLLREAIRRIKGDLRRVTFEHIDAVHGFLSKERPVILDLPGQVVAARAGDELAFRVGTTRLERKAARPPRFSHEIFKSGFYDKMLIIPEIGKRIVFSIITRDDITDIEVGGTAFFDLERLIRPLTVRNILPGDCFVPLGMTGTQKVKAVFINHKVPPRLRRDCPVIVCDGRIVWLAGFRIADPVKVSPVTTTVLKAEIMPL